MMILSSLGIQQGNGKLKWIKPLARIVLSAVLATYYSRSKCYKFSENCYCREVSHNLAEYLLLNRNLCHWVLTMLPLGYTILPRVLLIVYSCCYSMYVYIYICIASIKYSNDYTHTPSDPLKWPSFMCFCMTPNILGTVFSLNSATNLGYKYRLM